MSDALSILTMILLPLAAPPILAAYVLYYTHTRPFLIQNGGSTSRIDFLILPFSLMADLRQVTNLKHQGQLIPKQVRANRILLWIGLTLFILAMSCGFLAGMTLEME